MPVSWEGWTAAFAGLADAESRANTSSRRPAALATLRGAQRQWRLEAGTPGPPQLLGYLLIRLVRSNFELKPDWIREIQYGLDVDAQDRLRRCYAPLSPPREATAVWAAAESMSRAAIGQRDAARTLAADASKTLTAASFIFSPENVDLGLWWCIETFAFLGEPDTAAPLLDGMTPAAASAVPASLALANGYLDKGDMKSAFVHASRSLTGSFDPATLRRFDPHLVARVADLLDGLWKANAHTA